MQSVPNIWESAPVVYSIVYVNNKTEINVLNLKHNMKIMPTQYENVYMDGVILVIYSL